MPPPPAAVQRIVQSHLESGMSGGDSSDGEADDGDSELARGCDPDSALESGEGRVATAGRGGGGVGVALPKGLLQPGGCGDVGQGT